MSNLETNVPETLAIQEAASIDELYPAVDLTAQAPAPVEEPKEETTFGLPAPTPFEAKVESLIKRGYRIATKLSPEYQILENPQNANAGFMRAFGWLAALKKVTLVMIEGIDLEDRTTINFTGFSNSQLDVASSNFIYTFHDKAEHQAAEEDALEAWLKSLAPVSIDTPEQVRAILTHRGFELPLGRGGKQPSKEEADATWAIISENVLNVLHNNREYTVGISTVNLPTTPYNNLSPTDIDLTVTKETVAKNDADVKPASKLSIVE